MINKYESKILNKLIDKFESSKTFIGDNKVKQSFSVKTEALFQNYLEHSNYDLFVSVNEAIEVLIHKNYIIAKKNKANVYSALSLNLDEISDIYSYLNRESKKDTNTQILDILDKYIATNEILNRFCIEQKIRIQENKSVKYFDGDIDEFENVLIAVEQLYLVEKETYMRDFSIRVYRDSKKFEHISTKVINLLYEYGDFGDMDDKLSILPSLNIIKSPTYVNFKGNGIITIKTQAIDLSYFDYDIAISSAMLDSIDNIIVNAPIVMTVENLTSFHTMTDSDMFCIYLGGFHNEVRRNFLKKLYKQNPNINYYHFGDIDAGGFYILEHLKNKTGIDFKPYKMDTETLKRYSDYTKKLTQNDRTRLSKLLDSQYSDTIKYMLENNCKLEQEAVNID